MLIQLEIHNMALIDNVSLVFGNGLNILTGETGAGKSIIIDSLHAIKGERLSNEIIKTGCDKTLIEAVFQTDDKKVKDILSELGIENEDDGNLIISREFSRESKNICRINGKIVTLSALNDISEKLFDIHGQHDSQSLLKSENHIILLDDFGGEKIRLLKLEYSDLLSQYKSLAAKIKSLSTNTAEREKRIDLLKFQIDEIKSAEIFCDEEEILAKKKNYLLNAEKIKTALADAYKIIFENENDSVHDNLNVALEKLNSISDVDEKYKNIANSVNEIIFSMEDIVTEIRKERDNIDFQKESSEQIGERLDLIFKLKRKYGNSISEILEYLDEIEKELEELYGNEENIAEYSEQMNKVKKELDIKAFSIHEERMSAAGILENKIHLELDDLEMKKTKFKVNVEINEKTHDGERTYFPNGIDKVEFLISPNVGEPLKQLSKIASGGELSRIMLAIKTILAEVDSISTLIFDEIDIGISGKTAQKVGEKLSYVSGNHQVICVTHLAQIASIANKNYLIEKQVENNNTYTKVKPIEGELLINEIARILGGINVSEITVKHAKEMLETSKELRIKIQSKLQ